MTGVQTCALPIWDIDSNEISVLDERPYNNILLFNDFMIFTDNSELIWVFDELDGIGSVNKYCKRENSWELGWTTDIQLSEKYYSLFGSGVFPVEMIWANKESLYIGDLDAVYGLSLDNGEVLWNRTLPAYIEASVTDNNEIMCVMLNNGIISNLSTRLKP